MSEMRRGTNPTIGASPRMVQNVFGYARSNCLLTSGMIYLSEVSIKPLKAMMSTVTEIGMIVLLMIIFSMMGRLYKILRSQKCPKNPKSAYDNKGYLKL